MTQWMVTNKRADFQEIGSKFHIDPVTARILRNRELTEEEEIRFFLSGGLADLYDPHLLKDGDRLTDILVEKIRRGASIRIIGDYDIDGVMSSYILYQGLMNGVQVAAGAEADAAHISVAIPNRITDGYGLNLHLIEEALADGVDTIITCDNGIAAIDEIAFAKKQGMTVLVTDHHEIPYEEVDGKKIYKKSEADAVVNPHQVDCSYPYKALCGAAVAWKMVVLLYEKLGIAMEKAYELLENVAFATVGDIMSLMGENRILVKEGLKRIHHTQNIGMRALIQRCGVDKEHINCYHFGFVMGPCINAAGRLDTARRALELFLTEDEAYAAQLAEELYCLNEARKDMTNRGVEAAKELAGRKEYEQDVVLVLYLPSVHESIAGIIAGRIREYYYKPTFILTDGEEGIKGSGRSIEAYSMYEELCSCKELLTRFGGHPMAAGVSLKKENIDEFRKKLNEHCSLSVAELEEKVRIDVPMPVDYVTEKLVLEFGLLEPFGKDNPRPMFADRNLAVERMFVVGKNRNVLRMQLRSEHGTRIEGIYFGDVDALIAYVTEQFGSEAVARAQKGERSPIRLSLVYCPAIHEFRGEKSLQYEIKYYR